MRPKQSSPSLSALRDLLLSEREKAEAELQKLGRSKRAWHAISVLSHQEERDFHYCQFQVSVEWHNYTEPHRTAFETWVDAQPVRPAEDSLDALWVKWWLKHAGRRRPRILEFETIPSGWLGGEELGKIFRNPESQPSEGESAAVATQLRTRRKARAWAQCVTLHLAWLKVHGPTVDKVLGPRTRVTRPARARQISAHPTRREHLLKISFTETTQEWRNAARAALADAALRTLDDPLSIFAAGVSLGQSYLAEVHARQARPQLAERAVLDFQSDAGHQTHKGYLAQRVKLAEAIVYSAARKLARHHRGPDSTARLLEMNAELQRIVKKLRGKPYTFNRLRQIVRDPAAAHSYAGGRTRVPEVRTQERERRRPKSDKNPALASTNGQI